MAEKRPAILTIDQGTTNSKTLLVSMTGEVLSRASRPMSVAHPQPGWAEVDATVLWDSVRQGIEQIVSENADNEIMALAITNQRESIVVWDAATGAPIGPCILWQCRRSSDVCHQLRADGHEGLVVSKSGLGLDPLFPAAKLAWLLDAVPGARQRAEAGELRAGTVDSWLIWNLTGGKVHATDASNASRTQLMNIDSLSWDVELAALFRVPLSLLPTIAESDASFGVTAAGATALNEGVPIRAVMGDSHAALFGHGIVAPGRIKTTLGTGSSLMVVTGERVHSRHGLSSTIAWAKSGRGVHALEGNISVSGQAAAFVVRLLNLKDEAELTALALSVPDSGGVTFVPALAGLGAPHWQDRARGLICGMTLATEPAHVARATLEAIALQIRDVFVAMEADLGATLPDLSVDGGAAQNDVLMQLLADMLGRPVLRPALTDVTAIGVARMAAEAMGVKDFDASRHAGTATFLPKQTHPDVMSKWRAAIEREKI